MTHKKSALFFLIFTTITLLQKPLVLASDQGLRVVSEYAQSAIKRGYGTKCSLEMKPVDTGGYYPCLDFGPYRYVVEYQRISGYVVQAGMQPYKIFQGPLGGINFTVDGLWRQDVPVQMLSWWSDVVEGGAVRDQIAKQSSTRKSAVERYIQSLADKSTSKQAEKPVAGQSKTEVQPQREADIGTPINNLDIKDALTTNIK